MKFVNFKQSIIVVLRLAQEVCSKEYGKKL